MQPALLFDWQPLHGVNHIDVNIIDDVYFGEIQESYDPRFSPIVEKADFPISNKLVLNNRIVSCLGS
jgi:hypothetical protein